MSFQTEIFPYRNNRVEFPNRLMRKVDPEFTKIISIPGYKRKTIGGSRCEYSFNEGTKFEKFMGLGTFAETCKFSARPTDKLVVKTLLSAWTRRISDRYLDLPSLERFTKRSFKSKEEAYEIIRQNHPVGAVKFLYNELPKNHGNLTLFGNSIGTDMTYNKYFTMLIVWDDLHCFGLTHKLINLNNRLSLGGGSTVHPALQAAVLWIHNNQQQRSGNIYSIISNS